MHECGIKCMYAETPGCMYADFGCMYAETLGCIVCECWVQSMWNFWGAECAVVRCIYMETVGCMYAVVGCKVCGCWAHLCGNFWVHVFWVQVYGVVGCLPDSR